MAVDIDILGGHRHFLEISTKHPTHLQRLWSLLRYNGVLLKLREWSFVAKVTNYPDYVVRSERSKIA